MTLCLRIDVKACDQFGDIVKILILIKILYNIPELRVD